MREQWPHCGLELPRAGFLKLREGLPPWVWAQLIASATSPRMSKLRDLATVNIFGVLGALELEPGPGWQRSGRSGAWKSRSASRSGRPKDSTSGGAESTVVEQRRARSRKSRRILRRIRRSAPRHRVFLSPSLRVSTKSGQLHLACCSPNVGGWGGSPRCGPGPSVTAAARPGGS